MNRNTLTRGMLLRMLADAGLVTVALALAVGIRLLFLIAFEAPLEDAGEYVRRDVGHFLMSCPAVIFICLSSFWISGFYTYSSNYLSRYKALVVTQGVTIGYVLFGFLSYFAMARLPISKGAWGLGWLLTVALLVAARVWSDVWKKHVTPESERLIRRKRGEERVLVIGGGGYIGSALIPQLLAQGINVRLLDVLMFGEEPLAAFIDHPRLEIVRGDFRNVATILQAVKHVDSVVHLGGIVGDPACSLDEELTIDINLVSTRIIAELARAAGVHRFVFASTCSVYGASDELLDERSAVRPVSLYGDTKRASEGVLLEMAGDTFSPTILRFATIYGLSGRTRFDLVVNLLTAKAKLDGEITVQGGDQWRPFVHVEDAARAIAVALAAPRQQTHGQVFNVGSNDQNFTIQQIAELVLERVPSARMLISPDETDHRNYRVSFNKIYKQLGFEPRWTVQAGIQQVLEAIAAGDVVDYKDARYSNAKYLTEQGATVLDKDAWARQLINATSEAGR